MTDPENVEVESFGGRAQRRAFWVEDTLYAIRKVSERGRNGGRITLSTEIMEVTSLDPDEGFDVDTINGQHAVKMSPGSDHQFHPRSGSVLLDLSSHATGWCHIEPPQNCLVEAHTRGLLVRRLTATDLELEGKAQ